jgi:excisionase family DNA binding protein
MAVNPLMSGMGKILHILESKGQALKAAELAELLRVTPQHIYRMAADGTIPSFRIGSAVRFDPKFVAEWLRGKMPQTVVSATLDRIAV